MWYWVFQFFMETDSTILGSLTNSTLPSAPSPVTTPAENIGLCKTDPNGFYAHPIDCQKYYQCAHGKPYEYSCAVGTLWNKNTSQCDWEANVTC